MANTSIYNAFERMWQHIVAHLGNKVDKVDGKGLSTNDFTNEDKEKLDSLSNSGGGGGNGGVYVGTETPDENANVWINPDGIVTSQEDIVSGVLAALPQWEGGSY